jgi:hypothetical protein
MFVLAAPDTLAQVPGNRIIVNTTLVGEQTAPASAVDAEGNQILVWVSTPQDDGLPGLFARRLDIQGIPQEEEFKVNSYWAPHGHPAVAMGRLGNFVVVSENYWIEGPVSSAVTARVFDLTGLPLGPEFRVNQYSEDFQGAPGVGMDTQGRFVAVWQSWGQDGDGFGIFARQYSPQGDPLGPEFQVNSYAQGDQTLPAVSMAPEGDFIVVWTSWGQDGDQSGVFAQRFSRTGALLGQEFRVNFETRGRQENPDITMDGLGNVVMCWQRYALDGEGYAVYARTFDRTAQLKGEEFMVHEASSDWQVFPAVDSDAEGNFLVAWQDRSVEGNRFDIMARLFNGYGQPLGASFRVDSEDDGRQFTPDVVMLTRTDFSFCWQSREKEMPDWNIANRMYRSAAVRSLAPRRKSHNRHEHQNIKPSPGGPPVGGPRTGF